MTYNSGRFRFDGGAATYIGTALLGVLITVVTLGICYPFALVLNERWRAKHSSIDGQRLIFTGSAMALFGTWIKWLALSVITLGIYLFWVGPRIVQWKWEHTDFDRAAAHLGLSQGTTVNVNVAPALPPAATEAIPPRSPTATSPRVELPQVEQS